MAVNLITCVALRWPCRKRLRRAPPAPTGQRQRTLLDGSDALWPVCAAWILVENTGALAGTGLPGLLLHRVASALGLGLGHCKWTLATAAGDAGAQQLSQQIGNRLPAVVLEKRTCRSSRT